MSAKDYSDPDGSERSRDRIMKYNSRAK